MAGQSFRAAVIIDLMGNIASRSRQFAGHLSTMGRSGQTAMQGLRREIRSTSGAIDQLGSNATGMFKGMVAGALGLAGVGYSFNKLFLGVASTRENMRIAMTSLNKGNLRTTQDQLNWIYQNARDTTWGVSGVMQEYRTSRGFGMKDSEARDFVTMVEDQGALHGWDLNASQGASMQLKQMYARQQITAEDANLLTGYGMNVYQTLAELTGKTQAQVRDLGAAGRLGPKTIKMLFDALAAEAKGAQKTAMNSWTGLTSQIGDTWENFAEKVMNKGPFDRLKNELRHSLNWVDTLDQDAAAELLAGRFNTAFDEIKQAAKTTWSVLQAGGKTLSWVDTHIVSLKKLAMVLGGVWLANKALRAGIAFAKPAWQLGTAPVRYPYRFYKRLRGRRGGGLPDTPDILQNPSLIQQVFVTNWPAGGVGDMTGYAAEGKGKRKRGPGRGRGRKVPVIPPATVPVAAKAGIFSRMFSGAGRLIGGAGRAAGRLLGSAGRYIAGSPVGRIAAKGMGALSWMGRTGGRWVSRLGGPLLSAASLAPVLLDESTSLHDKGSAIGGTAGAWAAGALGSLAGPLGTVAGSALGGVVGDYLGGFVADLYSKWSEPKEQTPPPEQKVSASAALKVELADGLRITSTSISEGGLGLDIYSGNNFIPW